MKINVVTTFHKPGYTTYAKNMIRTFLSKWPETVNLIVYAEDCVVKEKAPNLIINDLHESSPDLVKFKETWKGVPKANGDVSKDPVRSKRRDSGKGFKWDAVRFSNKVYSIHQAMTDYDCDYLVWMDADMICHSHITVEKLQEFFPKDRDLCFLGRKGKFSECGLYGLNIANQKAVKFMNRFKNYYDNAEQGIFKLDEWHDSFVFDAVRKTIKLNELDWAKGLVTGEGHPLINSEWGAYLDHLKGSRKQQGRSKKQDLLVRRNESYWKNI